MEGGGPTWRLAYHLFIIIFTEEKNAGKKTNYLPVSIATCLIDCSSDSGCVHLDVINRSFFQVCVYVFVCVRVCLLETLSLSMHCVLWQEKGSHSLTGVSARAYGRTALGLSHG